MEDAELAARFEAACTISTEAGALARRLFEARKPGTFSLKGRQDYLTEADGEVERLIARRIAERFPEDSFVGEEHGGEPGERAWVVDPIDGTANFARGNPHFCTSVAIVESGQIEVGVVYDPCRAELFAACRGQGATVNGRPIRVSTTTDPRAADVELGWSPRLPMSEYSDLISRVVATGAGFSRAGSGALALAYVAAGRRDAYAELHINAWDALAGILLVREAGGWVNDLLAGNGLTRGNPVLATTLGLSGILREGTGIAG